MTFSTRDCQSRHVILYVNFLRTCRTNFHACRSRDDQTRPLFERENCQFLKKKDFRCKVRISNKKTFSTRDCQSRHVILYVNFLRTCRTNFHACRSRDDQTRPLFERANCQFLKKMNFDALSESQKMTFSTRDCQSRHVILYVNFLRTCRTNFHACRSRDDQTRPLFERANCQFLKKMNFDALSESQKMTFSTRDCQSRHVILYVNFLRTCRTNFHACRLRDDQTRPLFERANCQFLKKKDFRCKVRISKKRPFLPGTVNHDMSFCTSTSSGPAGQIFMLAGHATTKLDPCLSVRIVNFSKK